MTWRLCCLALGALAAALLPGCDYAADLWGPLPVSKSSLTIALTDTAYGIPVSGVRVTMGGRSALSDSLGEATFVDIETGPQICTLLHNRYLRVDTLLPVTLEPKRYELSLERTPLPPTVALFDITPKTTLSAQDTIRCHFAFHDSTGGIDSLVVFTGDNRSIVLRLLPTQLALRDSLDWTYGSAGNYTVSGVVYGGRGDFTLVTGGTVKVSANQRPVFTSAIRLDAFYSDREGYLQFEAVDPDGNIGLVVVDWGDSTIDTTYEVESIYWHTYTTSVSSWFTVIISLFDNNGARTVAQQRLRVSTLDAPRLDPDIIYSPSPPLTPLHDSLTVGVRVRQAQGYIAGVTWVFNQGLGDSTIYRSQSYSPEEGAVNLPNGTVFECRVPTQNLIGENSIKIIVTDNFNLHSQLDGTFQILGKE